MKKVIFTLIVFLASISFVDAKEFKINSYENNMENNSVIIMKTNNNNNTQTNISFDDFCEKAGIKKALRFLGYIIYIVKVLIPILLIIFGSIDFGKALIASNQDAIQKATKALIIRTITGIIIFLLPTVINYVFKLVGNDESKFKECRTCVLDVRNCGEITE